MVNRAKMEKQAAQAKMPNQKNNSCPYLLSAIVMLLQVVQVKQDLKDPMDHQVMPAIQVEMDNQDLKDHQAHQDHQANLENLDQKDPTVTMVL
jgi:hypothetical protein